MNNQPSSSALSVFGCDRNDLLRLWIEAGEHPQPCGGQRAAVGLALGHGGPIEPMCSAEARSAALRQIFKNLYGHARVTKGGKQKSRGAGDEPLSRRWVRALGAAGLADLSLPVELVHTQRSSFDGSLKMVMRPVPVGPFHPGLASLNRPAPVGGGVSDQDCFESVLIPERGRLTQCVSSQIGCAQACRFCQTGRMGLRRNLSAAEIVSQVVLGQRIWRELGGSVEGFGAERVTNVVFMGMGEPLDNTEAVLKSCGILSEPLGLAIGPRHITISTVGLRDGLESVLTQSPFPLALSLHSPFDEERSRIMPVNRLHPIREVLELMARLRRGREQFFIQYTLIRGVNDTRTHAEALADLLQKLPCKVNLIPLNEHDGAAFRRPGLDALSLFRSVLKDRGLVVTVRFSKGRDIEAACGQLVKNVSRRRSLAVQD